MGEDLKIRSTKKWSGRFRNEFPPSLRKPVKFVEVDLDVALPAKGTSDRMRDIEASTARMGQISRIKWLLKNVDKTKIPGWKMWICWIGVLLTLWSQLGQHTMPWRWRRGRRFYFPTWQPVHFNKNVVVDWTYVFSAYPVRLIATAGNDLHLASYNDRSQERQINPDWQSCLCTPSKRWPGSYTPSSHPFLPVPTELVTVKWPSWKETQQDHCKTASSQKFGEPQNLLVF